MKKESIKRPIILAAARKSAEAKQPQKYPIVNQWIFPLSDKVATLHMIGETHLNDGDMDDLLEMVCLFQKVMKKRNAQQAPDYEI